MDFEIILNKIVDITEKNLQIQSEFIKAIYELKNKLNEESYTKEEIRETLKELDYNIDKISVIMGKVSNEEIINLLYLFKEDKTNFSNSLKNYLEKFNIINGKIDTVLNLNSEMKDFKKDFKDLKEKVLFATNIQKIAIGILAALTIITGAFQYFKVMSYDKTEKKIEFLVNTIEMKEHENSEKNRKK